MKFLKTRGFDKIDLLYIFLAVGAIVTPLAWLAATFIAPFGSVQQFYLVEKSSPWSYLIIIASQIAALALVIAYFKKASKRTIETILVTLLICLGIISLFDFFPHFAVLIVIIIFIYLLNHFYFKPEHQKGTIRERISFIALAIIIFSYPIYISWYFTNIRHALLDQTLVRENWEQIPLSDNASVKLPKGCLFFKSTASLFSICTHQLNTWKEAPPFCATLGSFRTEVAAQKAFDQFSKKCCKEKKKDYLDSKTVCMYSPNEKSPNYDCQIINGTEVYTLFFKEKSKTAPEALARINYYLQMK